MAVSGDQRQTAMTGGGSGKKLHQAQKNHPADLFAR